MKNKSKKIMKIIPLILLIVALISILSYALLTIDFEGTKISGLKKPEVSLSLEENKNIELALDEMTDDEGKKQTNYVEFTVSSTGKYNGNIPVYIYLKEIEIPSDDTYKYLRVYLSKVENGVEKTIISPTKIVDLTEVKEDSTNYLILLNQTNFNFTNTEKTTYSQKYKLRLWLNDLSDEGFSSKTESDGSVTGETKDQNYVFRIKVMTKRLKQGELITEDYPETKQLAATTSQRYIGYNPDNYVSFNNELWRIIGTFDVDDGTGKLEKRIKLIRNESIGKIAWDDKSDGSYASDWAKSSGMKLLNEGDYWNRTGSYASNGLTPKAKSQIADAKWYLGGIQNYNGLVSHFYGYERGETGYNGDGITRPTSWIGKVGLMYPSDYGYATSGGTTTNRQACLAKEMFKWNDSSVSDCKNNDWLYDSSNYQWTLSPSSGYSNYAFYVSSAGGVYGNNVNYPRALRPSVYLKSDIRISGSGTSSSPYEISG